MNIAENIIKARSHLAFIIGLTIAAILSVSLDNTLGYAKFQNAVAEPIVPSIDQTMLATPNSLTTQDILAAKTAWAYFETNYNTDTGLVNSVDGFPSTTVWDQSSYMLGLISAYRIGLLSQDKFDKRLSKVLQTLAALPLFLNKLPNKVYDTRSLEMTTYSNQPAGVGIGWSALDVARITVPLNVILYDYPKHASAAAQILTNWDFGAMVQNGVMLGARISPETGLPEIIQEGRLGYEEYGARALGLLGLDTLKAARYDDYLKLEKFGDLSIATDSRSFELFDAPNYVVSEPYILMAIEFGLDTQARELAHRIYRAQQDRYITTGQLTAVSEDNINQEPYFVYNSVFANGKKWAAVSEDGASYPDLRTISTKAVFGWDALYGTEYTQMLLKEIQRTRTDDRGWLSGIYEKDSRINDVATANTNGIILEAINYKANGPLLSSRFIKGDKQ